MLANKDAAGFLAPLARQACSLTAVPIHGHACHTPDALARTAAALGLETGVADTVDDALRRIAARHATPDPVVPIVGSLYLAGEVLAATGELPACLLFAIDLHYALLTNEPSRSESPLTRPQHYTQPTP